MRITGGNCWHSLVELRNREDNLQDSRKENRSKIKCFFWGKHKQFRTSLGIFMHLGGRVPKKFRTSFETRQTSFRSRRKSSGLVLTHPYIGIFFAQKSAHFSSYPPTWGVIPPHRGGWSPERGAPHPSLVGVKAFSCSPPTLVVRAPWQTDSEKISD